MPLLQSVCFTALAPSLDPPEACTTGAPVAHSEGLKPEAAIEATVRNGKLSQEMLLTIVTRMSQKCKMAPAKVHMNARFKWKRHVSLSAVGRTSSYPRSSLPRLRAIVIFEVIDDPRCNLHLKRRYQRSDVAKSKVAMLQSCKINARKSNGSAVLGLRLNK